MILVAHEIQEFQKVRESGIHRRGYLRGFHTVTCPFSRSPGYFISVTKTTYPLFLGQIGSCHVNASDTRKLRSF